MRRIAVRTVEDLRPGMFIAEVDSDYPLDTFVPSDVYDAAEQDWQRVARVGGYVDLPTLTLEHYNGEAYTARVQATATVWVLFDGDEPVVQAEPNG